MPITLIPELFIGQPHTLVGSNEASLPQPTLEISPGKFVIPPGTVVGDFLIGDLLGRGSEAAVYSCIPRAKELLKTENYTERAPLAMRIETLRFVPAAGDRLLRVKDCCEIFRGRPFVETISMVGIYVVGGGEPPIIQVRALMPRYRSNLFQLAHYRLDEPTLRSIAYQLLKAVDYFHSEGYCHGDLSGSNVFIDFDPSFPDRDTWFPDETVRVHLGDFGFVRPCTGGLNGCADWLGTQYYRSFEALMKCKKSDRQKWDMWSVGIILFHLMTGLLPGYKPDEGPEPESVKVTTKEMMEKEKFLNHLKTYFEKLPITFNAEEMSKFEPDAEILANLSNFNSSRTLTWKAICPQYSDEALSLLSCLLQPNPDKRLSALEALQLPFFFAQKVPHESYQHFPLTTRPIIAT